MPRNDRQGVHVEYTGKPKPQNAGEIPRIERVFGSEIRALRSAMKNGNRVVFVEYGETLESAIERDEAAPAPATAAARTRAARKPKPGSDVPLVAETAETA